MMNSVASNKPPEVELWIKRGDAQRLALEKGITQGKFDLMMQARNEAGGYAIRRKVLSGCKRAVYWLADVNRELQV